MGLIFEDPPSPKNRQSSAAHHSTVAAQLKERPGEWARAGAYGSYGSSASMARHIRQGHLAAYRPQGAFEAVARTVDGEYRVYARYVGEGGNE